MSNFTNYKPNYAIHPGEDIADFIGYRNWSQRELAQRTGLHENTISNIINGKDSITPEVAERFGRVFGMKKSFFINLQTLYDETLPRQVRIEETEILQKLSYKEMVKYGWLPETKNINEKIQNLYHFLGIASLKSLSQIGAGAIAFRKKETSNFSQEALALWLRKGELECLNLEIIDFDKKKLEATLDKIRSLTLRPFEDIRQELKEILLECGVILCYTPKLTNSCVNGASRWYGNNILIQISDSGKKEDIFWFTLFHELGHTLKHLYNTKKTSFVDLENSEEDDKEIEADEFAKNTLIPSYAYQSFIQKKQFTNIYVKGFSQEIGVDEGIVVGRLCNENLLTFDKASKFRKKLEFIIPVL